jgi:hypothetical protein
LRNLWRSDETPSRATWYAPLQDKGAIDAAVAFALAVDGVTASRRPAT